MNQEVFERLWAEAATQRVASQLTEGYPDWHRRVLRRRRATLSLALVCAVGVSVLLLRPAPARGYDKMACNRESCSGDYCLAVANEMLTTQV